MTTDRWGREIIEVEPNIFEAWYDGAYDGITVRALDVESAIRTFDAMQPEWWIE